MFVDRLPPTTQPVQSAYDPKWSNSEWSSVNLWLNSCLQHRTCNRLFFLNRKTNQALKPAVPLMSTRGRLQKRVSPHGHVKMTNLTAVNKSSQPAIKYSFGLHQYFHLQQLQWVNLCNYSQQKNNSGL